MCRVCVGVRCLSRGGWGCIRLPARVQGWFFLLIHRACVGAASERFSFCAFRLLFSSLSLVFVVFFCFVCVCGCLG